MKKIIFYTIAFCLLLFAFGFTAQRNQLKWATAVLDEAANTFAGWNASGDATALTATQATAALNTFTSGAKGLAPASGGGTSNFLRADGTWAAAGGGSGVANTAAANEIPVSDGTDIGPSGLFATTDGSGEVTMTTSGSGTDVNFSLEPKGDGAIYLGNYPAAYLWIEPSQTTIWIQDGYTISGSGSYSIVGSNTINSFRNRNRNR
jgi:hypothetical protein